MRRSAMNRALTASSLLDQYRSMCEGGLRMALDVLALWGALNPRQCSSLQILYDRRPHASAGGLMGTVRACAGELGCPDDPLRSRLGRSVRQHVPAHRRGERWIRTLRCHAIERRV